MCIRDRDEYNEALEIKRICHEHKVPLIINDNVQFAIDIDADGVHLGQDDIDVYKRQSQKGCTGFRTGRF